MIYGRGKDAPYARYISIEELVRCPSPRSLQHKSSGGWAISKKDVPRYALETLQGSVYIPIPNSRPLLDLTDTFADFLKYHLSTMRSQITSIGLLLLGVATHATGLAIPELDLGSPLASRQSCALPSTYRWTDAGGPLAQPKNGWASLKDFTVSTYNGNYIIYGSNWNGASYGSFGETPFHLLGLSVACAC